MATECVEITIDVPVAAAGAGAGARARQLLVLDAVRREQMDWRAAASAPGVSLSAFLDLAKEHGVPVVRYALEDWSADRVALDKLANGR